MYITVHELKIFFFFANRAKFSCLIWPLADSDKVKNDIFQLYAIPCGNFEKQSTVKMRADSANLFAFCVIISRLSGRFHRLTDVEQFCQQVKRTENKSQEARASIDGDEENRETFFVPSFVFVQQLARKTNINIIGSRPVPWQWQRQSS